jgi:hypothetical protein
MLVDNELGIDVDITYEDPRYPTLVLESEQFGKVGYWLDLSNGELTRTCICNAYCSTECLCGAFDYYEDKDEECPW